MARKGVQLGNLIINVCSKRLTVAHFSGTKTV